jgi:hypothetical protein
MMRDAVRSVKFGKVSYASPYYDTNTVLGDFNAKLVKQSYLYPACGGQNFHYETNDFGKQKVNFTLGREFAVT